MPEYLSIVNEWRIETVNNNKAKMIELEGFRMYWNFVLVQIASYVLLPLCW
jgi:hypothetical protein